MTERAPPPPRSEARLRDDARTILRAGVDAVDPEELVADALAKEAERTRSAPGRVILLAGGKAALPMARGARRVLGDAISDGVIVGPPGGEDPGLPGIRYFQGGHPLPTEEGARGARALLEAAGRAGPDGRILFLLSGGGSAILTLPPDGIPIDDVRVVTRLLLEAGAPIDELNAVRKHLDLLKGGRLARATVSVDRSGDPTPLTALILSDVVGDRLDVIASGPVSPDPTSFSDAIAVLEDRGVWDAVPEAVREHLRRGRAGNVPETPGLGDPVFRSVRVEIVGNARTAARGARREAERRGYATSLLTTALEGEAREAGALLATTARRVRMSGEPVAPPGCVVSAGETTVTLRGDGRGGRNQELVLGASLELDGMQGVLVASLGTDGVDGPTDAAGALATGSTVERARAAGLDPADSLTRNDAHPFFSALGDLLVTGPTGTNVMDLQVALVARL